MNIQGKKVNFRSPKRHSNPFRLLLWGILIVAGFVVMRGYYSGTVKPLFLPTFTPTRTTNSYALEGDTDFTAGDLEKAIAAYQKATALDPNDGELWAKLARIQTYSSISLTTSDEQLARLKEAMASIDHAVSVAPDNSMVHATRAFVEDWYANPVLVGDQVNELLTDADHEVTLALTQDPTNTLALAYRAEILVDQGRLDQAVQSIAQAEQQDSSLMDVHRIYGYVYESRGEYSQAITEYKKAIEIAPNLNFLKIRVGKIYRHQQLWDLALEIFDQAAKQNEQLGINDPIPYLAIANTYIQMPQADFRLAENNVMKALELDPTNPDVYAQLGMVYHSARNYEGSLAAFQCALDGCGPALSCQVRNNDEECSDAQANNPAITVNGMSLTGDTVAYYYTYGSVLAGLHVSGDNYCTLAMQKLNQVADNFSSDSTIMSIVKAGEDICSGG